MPEHLPKPDEDISTESEMPQAEQKKHCCTKAPQHTNYAGILICAPDPSKSGHSVENMSGARSEQIDEKDHHEKMPQDSAIITTDDEKGRYSNDTHSNSKLATQPHFGRVGEVSDGKARGYNIPEVGPDPQPHLECPTTHPDDARQGAEVSEYKTRLQRARGEELVGDHEKSCTTKEEEK